MNLTIEDIRKYLSSICQWLTTNKTLCFLRDDDNRPTSARSMELTQKLDNAMIKNRTLFNKFSESIEDTEVCQKNLKISIEQEKIARKKNVIRKM